MYENYTFEKGESDDTQLGNMVIQETEKPNRIQRGRRGQNPCGGVGGGGFFLVVRREPKLALKEEEGGGGE